MNAAGDPEKGSRPRSITTTVSNRSVRSSTWWVDTTTGTSRDILREVSRDVPVVVSTHQVDDLTDLFDTVVVMDRGRLPFSGTPDAFMALAPADSAHPAEAAYGTLVAGD